MTSEDASAILLEIDAVTFRPANPFRYESGLFSPIYVDCRLLASNPGARTAIVNGLAEPFGDSDTDIEVVVGTGSSAISLADNVSRRLNLPMAYTRRQRKGHGTGKQIDGAAVEGKNVLLISDIISTGQDIPTSIEAIRSSGGKITQCRAVFDMELDENIRVLEDAGIDYASLTDLPMLLTAAVFQKRLSGRDRDLVKEWHRDPHSWEERRKEELTNALQKNRREVAKLLLKNEAVQIDTVSGFVYSSQKKGPIYTDNRILLGHPAERAMVIDTMVDTVVNEIGIQNIAVIGAVASAGISFASALSDRLEMPMVIVNPKPEERITQTKIDGRLSRGDRVLLVEDLVNSAKSLVLAAEELRGAGAIVSSALAVMTNNTPAASHSLTDADLSLHTLTDLDSLLRIAQEEDMISAEEAKVVEDWRSESAHQPKNS